jgi:hypothetical protein
MSEPDVLETIRRAYRYIVAYERRMLDTVRMVDEVVLAAGLERRVPYRWDTLYREFPSRTFAPDRWAWDGIPNYACRYQWLAGTANTAGNRWVLLDHVADTTFEADRLASDKELDPLMPRRSDARSVIRWIHLVFAAPIDNKVYSTPWTQTLATHFKRPFQEIVRSEPTLEPVFIDTNPLKMWGHCVEIAELTGEAAIQERLLAPLKKSLEEGRAHLPK